MALGEIPSWISIRPTDFVAAGTAGAEAGLGAARTALEARSISDRASQAAAALSSHEHLQAMEMQARREIAEQNRLRDDQQMAIENAYRTAQIGLGKQRIEEQQALAEAKAKQAAAQFAAEQGIAQDIAGGKTFMQAIGSHPGARPAYLEALRLSQAKEPGQARVATLPGSRPGDLFLIEPSGTAHFLPKGGLSESTIEHLTQRLKEQRRLFKPEDAEYKEIDADIKRLQSNRGSSGITHTWDTATGSIKPIKSSDLSAEPSHDEEQ